jgi:type IV secretory pathway VirB10-like protein
MTDDPQLARLLDAWAPPPLPAGFAERLMAHAEAGQTLPPVFPPRHRLRAAWSRTRFVVGGVAIGLMTATAAAAAGVFGNVGITIPAWQRTVEKVTGIELAEAEPVAPQTAPAPPPAAGPPAPAPTLREIVADGRIESRAELEAAAQAVDARRAERQERVRERRDARVDALVAERRAQGLPAPTDEQLAARRARRDARAAQREEAAAARRDTRREALGQRLDNGETIDLEAERQRLRERLGDRLTPRQRERLERWQARRDGAQLPPAVETVPQQDSDAPPPEN